MPADLIILVMLILGLAFMALEAFAPSFGLLGIGGLVSFLTALNMLRGMDSFYGYPVDMPLVIALGIIGITVLIVSLYCVLLARRKTISAGSETMIGNVAKVVEWDGASGRVHTDGEIWAAEGATDLHIGDAVIITDRRNLVLIVEKGR